MGKQSDAAKTGHVALRIGMGIGAGSGNAALTAATSAGRRGMEKSARDSAYKQIAKKYGSETMKSVKAKQLRRDIAPTVVSLAIMGMGMKAYKDKYEDY